jgi:predicted ferric reductase
MNETLDLVIWQFIRAAGLLSYILLSIGVFVGIALKCRLFDGALKRPWVNEAHQSLTLAALGLMALHLVLVLANSHVPFTLLTALVPFASHWKTVPTANGILALYLALALVASSYLQRLIGYRTWRTLHYTGFLAWLTALLHGITEGSDTGLLAVQTMYWVTAASVLFITVFRLLLPSPVKLRPTSLLAVTRKAGT